MFASQCYFFLSHLLVIVFVINCIDGTSKVLPTLYEHYTAGGIKYGLSDACTYFTLNKRPITIYSGSLHYFRVHPQNWRDRLRKMRAAGLNTVQTYVPWNLHEPMIGVYDFGYGGTDFEEFLCIKKFIEMAQEEDLFVIVRPGPYICAEWEFGGLPSWLLRYQNMKIRTSDSTFLYHVSRYFKVLFSILTPLQFTKGGPILSFQIENEYGNTKNNDNPVDRNYLQSLRNIFIENGVVELLFTSDTPSNGFSGTIQGVLATANLQNNTAEELTLLKHFQPNKPLMITEYWTGWYDHWTEKHHTRNTSDFFHVLENINKFNASFNMYMFSGGSNWGFLNGADMLDSSTDNGGYTPDITSYDYDAPITEAGDYTEKYYVVEEFINKYNKIKTRKPSKPRLIKRFAYSRINITEALNMQAILEQIPQNFDSKNVIPMELLDMNSGSGQSYGYIVYRKEYLDISAKSVLKIEGRVCDTILVLINGELVSKILDHPLDLNGFGYWRWKNSELELPDMEFKNATLDLVVENWGRNTYGKLDQFRQYKGLWQGNVLINSKVVLNWKIFPLQFKKTWTSQLSGWKTPHFIPGPYLYKALLYLNDIKGTFVDLSEWGKGIIMVNDFVLGRYFHLGPQQCVYLPQAFLTPGKNKIIIFEHFRPSSVIKFTIDPFYTN